MTQDLRHLGIIDLDEKHIVVCRPVGGGPQFSLLWRTKGKRGKPLPEVGQVLKGPVGYRLVVERIDPPGTHLEFPNEQGKGTLIVTPHAPERKVQ